MPRNVSSFITLSVIYEALTEQTPYTFSTSTLVFEYLLLLERWPQ